MKTFFRAAHNRVFCAKWQRTTLLPCVAALLYAVALLRAQAGQAPDIFVYIQQNWDTLTRSPANIAKAAVDPKFQPGPDGRWAVYISKTDDISRVTTLLRSQMTPDD